MIQRRPFNQQQLTERSHKNLDILELLRRRGPLTRTELSQGTGLNVVTVSNYVAQFIRQGLIVERGFDISSGGRKPILVELNPKSGFAIGVDLGVMDVAASQTVGVITDLRGTIVHRVVRQRRLEGFDEAFQEARELIQEVLHTSPIDPKKIHGIGVGLPGIVDDRAGTVRGTSSVTGRTNYLTIQEAWEAAFALPVLMGNDATLAGYGELRLGLDHPVDNFVYLYSDVGVSLILNGEVYWGSSGGAGQSGIFIPSEDDYLAWVKAPSFVATNVWDLGIAAQAQRCVTEGQVTAIGELVDGRPERITLATVLQAAHGGDVLARDLIEHAALQLGIRIASLINLLNPEVVVIGGGIERAGSMFLEPAWRAVKRYAYEEPASLVDILPAKLGENAVALGAACWVIREMFVQA